MAAREKDLKGKVLDDEGNTPVEKSEHARRVIEDSREPSTGQYGALSAVAHPIL